MPEKFRGVKDRLLLLGRKAIIAPREKRRRELAVRSLIVRDLMEMWSL